MALLLHLCQQEVLDAQHLQEMLAGAVTCHCWGVSAPRLACRALVPRGALICFSCSPWALSTDY